MNKYSYLVVFFIAFLTASTQAQNTIPKDSTATKGVISYERGKEYILGGITVTGLQKFSEQTVRVYTGLVDGQPIKLPGDKLTSAIKKLYESKQFSEVDVYLSKRDGNTVYLQFDVTELPQLLNVTISGVSKSKRKEIQKETDLKKGAMVTDNLIVTTRNYIKKKYTDKGFLKTKVTLNTRKDTSDVNTVSMNIFIDKGKRIKIKEINFIGNKAMSDGALRGAMKNTKRKFLGRFWKSSKYIIDDYKEDLESILEKYSENGYRDARILSDKLTWNDDNTINLEIELDEGRQYRFDDIKFIGNKKYSDEFLHSILRIEKGDIYNGKVLKERISGDGTPTSTDIQTLYHNNGYLFSQVNAVETKVNNDSITVEVRIREDEPATIKRVTVSGNDKTNDHVIFRELRVKPGDLFSRQNIIRSIREIGQLGFFDANVSPDVKPDYQNKTADIDFSVVEKGGSQIELQGGYGGGSFIGTLGLSFNNFSIRNIFNKEAYKPLPMGDGQKLSLRLQASRTFNTYSFSFTEPWLGGKTPQSLSFSVYLSNQYRFDFQTNTVDKNQRLSILGATVGLGKRLSWPDDYFSLSQSISYQRIELQNYGYRVGSSNDVISQGNLNNLAYTVALSRNSAGPTLIFPTYGSEFTVRAKATFPYSLVNGKSYTEPNNPTNDERQAFLADKYKWLEYYKISAKGKWYTALADKLVLMSNFEMGYLGTYNDKLGLTPVERYFVGGDGIAQGQLDGREVIGLRGYENNRLSSIDGGSIYNKFQLELRYSITDKPSASIYTLGFLEAGNSYDNFSTFNPFNLKRSAGLGIRIFMPAFGLLGIDFAHGFDPLPGLTQKSGWQTHFIIGRQF
ncbi:MULTISPECIES: outer membrane protein assembly factor BamA [unclassified Tenacibaculum]|uniref:outer membrane protein assembly factor BamA n=1 Tax=unclassified Tenacibaculum TaxID=2635139 RepID=UPI001F266A6C|nr:MULTISPECIES: outer membrane protein assembly factor BamA [unclassified Tenacibaculum]MCF2873676.1 outer membrane protein assembly factor BamA [Tenacibaculum sp. Cn5-1]MCF2933832.1 outer membrane protein assembly factor BamA [Tenacibaculum sp. Cn5-34]MCG7509586.1 outer membrane protein assembly factor BamA [Tenacibaculum sp. Cn5-46]